MISALVLLEIRLEKSFLPLLSLGYLEKVVVGKLCLLLVFKALKVFDSSNTFKLRLMWMWAK